MKVISLFNNKGGVGKSTLAFHLSNVLADMGKKILMIDLDPQCNLTICGMEEESLHEIWSSEDVYIDDFYTSFSKLDEQQIQELLSKPKTIHFLLKPTEDGQGDLPYLPPVVSLKNNLDLIPGRLTVHQFENKISERWNGNYSGDPLSLRTTTRIRTLAEEYAALNQYDFVIIDTSPSLGALNKVIISTVDGFLIPTLPDMFSTYGIINIGNSLSIWFKELNTIYGLISEEKRSRFPKHFVRFIGYTIYNAKKYTKSSNNPWNLATAHYNYAAKIPQTIINHIGEEVRSHLTEDQVNIPVGLTAVMHTHNTLPNMAQKYKMPIWCVPSQAELEGGDKSTVLGNRESYESTKAGYMKFAEEFLIRVSTLD